MFASSIGLVCLHRIGRAFSRAGIRGAVYTHVGVEETQDELEVRLLAGDERHLCGLMRGIVVRGVSLSKNVVVNLGICAGVGLAGATFELVLDWVRLRFRLPTPLRPFGFQQDDGRHGHYSFSTSFDLL